MTSELIPETPSQLADPTTRTRVAAYVDASLAASTRRAYRTGLADFRAWCTAQGLSALPSTPESVAGYLAHLADAGRSVSTVKQRVAAIAWAHEAAGLESPTAAKGVQATLAGIRRELGVLPLRKQPATVERLATMVAHTDAASLKGIRDRALLLFGFASALRRSELAALTTEDVEATERGLLITIRKSKTDPEAKDRVLAVPFGRVLELCPVAALNRWLEAAHITEGPLFRSVTRHGRMGAHLSDRAIAEVVKLHAKRAGFDPADFSGHSLRAGFVTSAAERGKPTDRIMSHTGHKSVAMLQVYTRRVDAFADHAGEGLL